MKKIVRFLCVLLSATLVPFAFGGCDFEGILNEILDQIELPFGKPTPSVDATAGAFTDDVITEISTSNLSIHFLELGNEYTGDCTLIKTGDTEVLIDAGSRKNSASAIVPYINDFCTDGVLEYVIATHAHQDHIAGFVGSSSADGVFESFVCETIIDYSLSNADSGIREQYEALRDEEVAAGATHYTAH